MNVVLQNVSGIPSAIRFALGCCTCWFLTSCVSAGKYDEMEAAKLQQERRADSLQMIVHDLLATVTRLDANIAERAADTIELHSTLHRQSRQIDSLLSLLTDMTDRMTMLTGNYNQLKANTTREAQKLLNNLEQAQQELRDKQQQQREAASQLKIKDSALTKAQHDIRTREQRLKDVEQKLQAREQTLVQLRNKISDALTGFKEGDLAVEKKNGRILISLSNRLLFASGSAEIEKNGKQALRQVAVALNKQTDVSIMVEGHTDDAKVQNLGAIKDNWDLSVLRSTEVIRFLTQECKVDPRRITASGRAEYAPAIEGSTPEIRAKNRRTEIIITPKLEELMEAMFPAGKQTPAQSGRTTQTK